MIKHLFFGLFFALIGNNAFAIDANTKLPADAITVKDASELVRALAKAEVGVCKDMNGQVKPCTLNVYDLFCKETAGLKKPEHACTFTNEWNAKTENRSGPAADGVYKALKDARLKMSCGDDNKPPCNTRMQNIECYASGVETNGSPRVSCAIIPKYHSLIATPAVIQEGMDSKVIGDHHVRAKPAPAGDINKGESSKRHEGDWDVPLLGTDTR